MLGCGADPEEKAPEDEAPQDTAWDYPEKRSVSAAGMPAPATTGARSIFETAAGIDMPTLREMARLLKAHGRSGHGQVFRASAVERTAEGVRCTGGQYPANRATEEKAERERQRRARQKPPKPSKRARSRSKKLVEVIGDDIWDE
jgi:hypothetical protein